MKQTLELLEHHLHIFIVDPPQRRTLIAEDITRELTYAASLWRPAPSISD